MVECARLEIECGSDVTVGSNPTLSVEFNSLRVEGFRLATLLDIPFSAHPSLTLALIQIPPSPFLNTSKRIGKKNTPAGVILPTR